MSKNIAERLLSYDHGGMSTGHGGTCQVVINMSAVDATTSILGTLAHKGENK